MRAPRPPRRFNGPPDCAQCSPGPACGNAAPVTGAAFREVEHRALALLLR
jgi:hypothetical protein